MRPLHGIPILLKDNIFTDDRTSASTGSYALLGSKAPHEATVAQKPRESGAILLGKVNLSEWANFRPGPNNGSNGQNVRDGQTYSAFFPGTESEGSSSGSAVSSILGLAFATVGTEADGSIVSPAQRSIVVGVAPTTGLIGRDGIIPLSNRQDTVGPLARTVMFAAHLLTAITRLDGLRIGVPHEAITDADETVMKQFERALELLEMAGATIADNVRFSGAKEWAEWDGPSKRAYLRAELKHSTEGWLKGLVENPNSIHSLSDII
ncbi:amidase signature enzyme [Lentithecium fluviatile CBS 122367]|uniref:Amidase signature enzyme n=1 Tax=Lentithecium fluviatile CBS 122367 TaxID=1168545 RepID=A0A6G1JE79_9PLEO|nr:amidase signature enzyme [Lentithecium fluviatile CBS 122367]